MNREEFVGYLESRGEWLAIPLHREGRLRGLPCEFHQAVAVACFLRALRQPAPTGDALRAWYGEAASASPETARWVCRVVGCLRNPDLQSLDMNDLLTFWPLLDEWAGMAHAIANDRVRKNASCQPV
jgi:hypothetical protein